MVVVRAQFDVAWLRFLACPVSKAPLRYDAAREELVSVAIGVAFPVVRGIPRLVLTEGRRLTADELKRASEAPTS